MQTLAELKREVFGRLLELAGRAYIQVRPSDEVRIGRRGLIGEEKEKGIVLVFNPMMKYVWDDYGLSATLLFGSAPEKCYIPAEDIVGIYSPDIGAQFTVSPDAGGEGEEGSTKSEPADNVIQVDFKKGKE
jgi:hypothetical protein